MKKKKMTKKPRRLRKNAKLSTQSKSEFFLPPLPSLSSFLVRGPLLLPFVSFISPSRTRLAMSLSQLRTAILRHASVGPSAAALSAVAAAAVGIAGRSGGGASSVAGTSRGYAASTYLDKDAVTSRVLSVVKAFDKVDPGKVRK
jgi:hypothetical protein